LAAAWLRDVDEEDDMSLTPSVQCDAKTSSQAYAAADRIVYAWTRAAASPRFAFVLFLTLSVWELGILLLLASRKALWYDELLTLHFSTLTFWRLWQALRSGADSMAAGYYFMVWLGNNLAGDPHVILRLSSVFGYVLTLFGVYWFVRKRQPAIVGVMAVMLITLSPFRAYALEARSYSLLVGFLAISALLWQRIDENRLMKPLFALFLTLAVSVHYFGVLAIVSIGVAETTWALLSRRIRWGVWVAFAVSTVPFLLGLPLLLRIRDVFNDNFWSKARWGMLVPTYEAYLGIDSKLALVLMLLLAFTAGGWLLQIVRGHRQAWAEDNFNLPELALICGFLVYPGLLVILTTLAGGGYTPRYGWPAILGLVLASVYLLRSSPRPASSAHLLAALLVVFVYQARFDITQLFKPPAAEVHEPWTKLAELSGRETDLPVVIASPLSFLEASYYAPPELRQRLVQLVSSTDKGNRMVAQFIPFKFEDLAFFQATHPRFVLWSGGSGDGMTQYLLQNQYRLTLLSQYSSFSLYIAERP
jgi:hypothetical protein